MTYCAGTRIAKETTVTPTRQACRTGCSRGEVAISPSLRIRESKFAIRVITVLAHIRPAFQLSGTVNVTEVEGAASHLRFRSYE